MELFANLWAAKHEEKAKILLLHGMGGRGSLWRALAANLEEKFSILAPDQRGHGGSQASNFPVGLSSQTYTPLDYGQDVVDTLNSKKFFPAWVVGHSMGVRTAAALAHLQPDWVSGLVLVDLGLSGAAGGGLGDELGTFLNSLPVRFASRFEARSFMEKNCPDPSMAQYLMAVAVMQADGSLDFPFDKAALIQTIYAAKNSVSRAWVEEFARTAKPVRVLRGAESLVYAREDFLAEQARFKKFPKVEFLEVPGTGHGLPFEKRLWFLNYLEELILREQP